MLNAISIVLCVDYNSKKRILKKKEGKSAEKLGYIWSSINISLLIYEGDLEYSSADKLIANFHIFSLIKFKNMQKKNILSISGSAKGFLFRFKGGGGWAVTVTVIF